MSAASDVRVLNLIEDLLKKINVSNNTIKILPKTDIHNKMGKIYSVKVEGIDMQSERIQLHTIVKLAIDQALYRDCVGIKFLYETEIFVYNKVLPEMCQFQDEKSIQEPFKPFAKIYASSLNDFPEWLILDDLTMQGFTIGNHQEPVTYPIAAFLMKELGKFHSLSFAMRDQKPQCFNELKHAFSKHYYLEPEVLKSITHCFKNIAHELLRTQNSSSDPAVFRTIKKLTDGVPENFKKVIEIPFEKHGVLNHGDFQLRNLFFKYKDFNLEEPTDLRIIDWQFVNFRSPAFDLLNFIYSSTDKHLRDIHYENLLHIYYESMCLNLTKLGTSTDNLIPFTEIVEDIKTLAPFFLYYTTIIVIQNYQSSELIQEFDAKTSSDDILQTIISPSNTMSSDCAQRIIDIITDFIKYEYYI